MRRYRTLLGFLLCSLAGYAASAALAAYDAGSEPALYLGEGARAVAMGRADATESGSVYAATWNPAGLNDVPRNQIALQHAALFGGALHDTLGFAYPILDWGALALTWTRMDLGGIERRDANNLAAGEFGFTQQEFALSYGREAWGPLSLGGTLKLHDIRLDGLESMSPGLDVGALATFPHPLAGEEGKKKPADAPEEMVEDVQAGLFVRNAIGPLLKLRDEDERLYPAYRLGAAAGLNLIEKFPDRLSLKLDVEKPERSDWRLHAGVEYAFLGHYAVRGGWDQEYFSTGAGIEYSGMTLDYAASFTDIGLRHLMTFTYAFGDDLRDIVAKRRLEQERMRQHVVDKLKLEIIEDYNNQAKTLAAAGKYPEAARFWEKVLDWDPENKETQENLKSAKAEIKRQEIASIWAQAQSCFKEERYVEAMVECKRIQDLDPANTAAREMYTASEKKATSLGEMAFANEVKSLARIREHYMVGLKAYANQDWEGAIKNWEQVIVDSPLQKQVYTYLDKARQAFEKARQEKGGQLSAAEQARTDLYKQAVTYSRSGKLKDAALAWEKLSKENPKDEDAKNNLEKTRKEFINSEKRGISW